MKYLPVLLLGVSLSACTLSQAPEPEVVPSPPPVSRAEVEALHHELTLLHQDLAALGERVDSLEPLTARIARLEALTLTPPSRKAGGKGKREPTPSEIVLTAQKEARVIPSERGYFGRSAEQTYVYQPGRVFTVLLKQYQASGIALPPGEQLVIGLALVESDFTVIVKRVGTELLAYDTIAITPLIEKGEVDAWVLTQSGRRYLLHLVIGPVGMIAVTFEAPPIYQDERREQKLILPKPQS